MDEQQRFDPTVGNSSEAGLHNATALDIEKIIEQQKVSARLLIRRDLELSRANERLRALDQMKTDFVSVATHQLRTPLSAIKWTLSMVLKGDVGTLTNEQQELLTKAYESNNRMAALLNDMLISDQIESGGFQFSGQNSTVTNILEELIIEMYPAAEKRNIHIELKQPDQKLPAVCIDPAHLRAVLQNLLENAVRYSKPSGRILIELSENGGMVSIVVADNGIGIPETEKSHLFQRFFRAPNAIKMETDGSGLGLFITKSIVERNRGTIRFESKENEGTTFFITLPAAVSAPSPKQQ
ncbi:MAG TPA: HAMP domain-containing sensor histidine kinase [Candidatus Paceibacterota bacterium]|nr:HAMP domain-containing sensor histidine kinase [Candidatus Paceibacterota bacterium]